jgi:hypothetical protein
MVILDAHDCIIAVLAGRPGGDWGIAMEGVEDAFNRARDKGYEQNVFVPSKLSDKRGDFPKLFTGFSFGNGQCVRFQHRHPHHANHICRHQSIGKMRPKPAKFWRG